MLLLTGMNQCPLSYKRIRYPNRSATARDVRRVNESDMEEGINGISPGSIRDQESSVMLDIKIEGHERTALLDTGARPSVIDMGTLEQHQIKYSVYAHL